MPTASNNELLGVLGIAALIGAIILYSQTPNTPPPPPKPVVIVQQPPPVVVKPAQWELAGVGPGWGGGRWLGEGDFKHFGRMDHPFRDRPAHSGHPMPMPDLPQAQPLPQAPPMRMGGGYGGFGGQTGGGYGSGGFGTGGYMMPPMGGAMGPTRY